MNRQALGNNLRTHRKKSGLSQREVGLLLGYKNQWQVSRHERSQTAPPLLTALAYEAIFRAPVSALFAGMHAAISEATEAKLTAFERNITPGKGRKGRIAAQKLAWLVKRRG
jgi:DNA-binding XRE family transcriptional regulator